MDLSVLTVSFRCVGDTLRSFHSLLGGGAEGLDWEFLVGDNGSGDAMSREAFPDSPRVRLFPGTENQGFGRENNRLALQAHGQYILLLNPDTVTPPDTLRHLVAHLEAHPQCGACAPQLRNPDGSRQFSWNTGMGLSWEIAECFYLQNRWRMAKEANACKTSPDGPWTVDFASAAALCIRRTVWEEVGGFDPAFFMNHEDIELCHRIRQFGHEIHVLPKLEITHFDSETQRKDWTGFVRNRLDGKWIALPRLYTGIPLLFAQGIWFLSAGIRFAISTLMPGVQARQRSKGYRLALWERLLK
jgi:GT2 family glycosyltransferase